MKQWTIARRISLAFAIIIAVASVSGVVAFFELATIGRNSNSLTTDSLPGIIILGQVQANALEQYGLVAKDILATDDSLIASLHKRIGEIRTATDDLYKKYEETIHTPEDRALYEADIKMRVAYLQTIGRVLDLSKANRNQEAFDLLRTEADAAHVKYSGAISAHIEWNSRNAVHFGDLITNAILDSKRFLIAGLLAAGALAALIGYFAVRGVNRRLRAAGEHLETSATQILAAAGQVSASSQSLAKDANEQAASLEETGASMEELTGMTRRNAESAQEAKTLANETRAAADTGAVDMEAMKAAMDEIKASSNDVSKIIKTIDEIAFQTNILALNAAVEAARAGEAGAGFAVVAEEVRNLAQRSADAAKETATRIDVAVGKSEHGVLISGKVARSLGEIVEKARRVDTLISEIAVASSEQSQGLGQVNTAVGRMDKITQANASSSEETAAAAEELNAQSMSLRETVGDLLALVDGRAKRPAA